MVAREHILAEIRRTAAANGGNPLGRSRFQQETGIRQADWEGRYWARWGDALVEAGFAPNGLNQPHDREDVVRAYIALVRQLGRLPVNNELKMAARRGGMFNPKTVTHHLGRATELRANLRAYCTARAEFDDVLAILDRLPIPPPRLAPKLQASVTLGSVYLLKSGRYYKIGRSNAPGRREYEIGLQLPDRAEKLHEIRTDDPIGIEAYWHQRFAARRKNGEWFDLTAADVAAFRRRRFM